MNTLIPYKMSSLTGMINLIMFLFLTTPVHGATDTHFSAAKLINESCTDGLSGHEELDGLKNQIIHSASLNAARDLALQPTNEALEALHQAQIMIPFSEDLSTAEKRLIDTRSRIMLASSQQQVADQFDGMLLAGLDDDRAASVNVGDSGSCSYSTGETIAIVVGLILGIIPGLILLVVLC
jgi:hypothetical protein